MHRVEIVAYTASMSLVFGALIIKNHIGYKNRIFNCRWSKKIVDVSHTANIFVAEGSFSPFSISLFIFIL